MKQITDGNTLTYAEIDLHRGSYTRVSSAKNDLSFGTKCFKWTLRNPVKAAIGTLGLVAITGGAAYGISALAGAGAGTLGMLLTNRNITATSPNRTSSCAELSVIHQINLEQSQIACQHSLDNFYGALGELDDGEGKLRRFKVAEGEVDAAQGEYKVARDELYAAQDEVDAAVGRFAIVSQNDTQEEFDDARDGYFAAQNELGAAQGEYRAAQDELDAAQDELDAAQGELGDVASKLHELGDAQAMLANAATDALALIPTCPYPNVSQLAGTLNNLTDCKTNKTGHP
nr:hypothetical protein [Endozoicomonas sp.]